MVRKIIFRVKSNLNAYLCWMITVYVFCIGLFVFPNTYGRLVESLRDLVLSIAYYFCTLFDISIDFSVAVNDLPDYSFLSLHHLFSWIDYDFPTTTLPETWEDFRHDVDVFCQLFVDKANFEYYLLFLSDLLLYVSRYATLVLPLILCLIVWIRNHFAAEYSPEDPPSKHYLRWKSFEDGPVYRFKQWIFEFKEYLQNHPRFVRYWFISYLLYFNVFTIFVEFFAFYFYFVLSFDISVLYRQLYKLVLDLYPVVRYIPSVFWPVILVVVLDRLARTVGMNRVTANEQCNEVFCGDLGIVTWIYGPMGEGKTSVLTDMALTFEKRFRDDALEIILECDVLFPNFPWKNIEAELKRAYESHRIYDKWSCLAWIDERRQAFDANPVSDNAFGYDVERYPLYYDNKMYLEYLFDVLADYALAYTIYTVQSSLLVSNYSIRVDQIQEDIGNFPVWDADFFARDSRLLDRFSRHSHILDFDMLRLGKKMIDDNHNANAFGWGVYVVSEADKEYKNTLELSDVKYDDAVCNQKNDLTHVLLKMSRHACSIRYRNFTRFIADMQRVENITANMRQIGNVLLITDTDDPQTFLPFFSPYKHFMPFLGPLKRKLDSLFIDGRYSGQDCRLIHYLLYRLRAAIANYKTSTVNQFGGEVVRFEMQTGRMDGSVAKKRYFKQYKKIYAQRYSSDCLCAIFSRRKNTVGLNDLPEYQGTVATDAELQLQHSHMQNEIESLQNGGFMRKEIDYKALEKQISANVEFYQKIQDGKVDVSPRLKKAVEFQLRELCDLVKDLTSPDEK